MTRVRWDDLGDVVRDLLRALEATGVSVVAGVAAVTLFSLVYLLVWGVRTPRAPAAPLGHSTIAQ